MSTRFFPTVLLPLAVVACVGCSGESNTVKIGYIGPLTGDAVSYGVDTLNATRIAVDEQNAKGGIHGHQIELIVEDGACTGSEAALAAHKLIDIDHVVAILGGNCSNETLAAAPVAEQSKTILLAPVTSSKDVTKVGDFVFRVWPSNDKAARTAYKAFFAAHPTLKRIAVLSEETNYCKSLHDSVLPTLPKDMQVVFDEKVDAGTKDVRSLLTRLKSADFDVLFVNMQGDSGIGAVVSQFRELGFTQTILTNDIGESITLGRQHAQAIDGAYLLSLALPDISREPGNHFVHAFRQKFGEPRQAVAFPAVAYDAARVLFDAIDRVGTDGPAIRDALYKVREFPGTIGAISFDANGDAYGLPYAIKQWNGGSVQQLATIPLE